MRKITKLKYLDDGRQHEEMDPKHFEVMAKNYKKEDISNFFMLYPTKSKLLLCETINQLIQIDVTKRIKHDHL